MANSAGYHGLRPDTTFIEPLALHLRDMVASKTSMSSRTQVIHQVLTEVLLPMVTSEGGELYLISVSDNEIAIHLTGRYSGSPAATLLCQELALPLIDAVAKGMIVNWSSGRLIPPNAVKLVAEPLSVSNDGVSS